MFQPSLIYPILWFSSGYNLFTLLVLIPAILFASYVITNFRVSLTMETVAFRLTVGMICSGYTFFHKIQIAKNVHKISLDRILKRKLLEEIFAELQKWMYLIIFCNIVCTVLRFSRSKNETSRQAQSRRSRRSEVPVFGGNIWCAFTRFVKNSCFSLLRSILHIDKWEVSRIKHGKLVCI